ncbi:MAG: acyl-ACP--UDP-N-acetylglucosamine O-acyltransferase [Alphaproteobacteria bacterium]|nr:acyl-ACP--UDP-N-acetylglucosamine O-acyltransferase [Alphaproteobacteria bacterium]
MAIHPSALVDPSAELGDVEIGPFAIIGAGVKLADGVVVGPHSVVHGPTTVGEGTVLHAHVVLGDLAQDRKHDLSVETTLVVGRENVFREFSTAHRGSSSGARTTVIGDRNYFMANSHVAHDCRVGDDCMFANSAAIAGHVQIQDGAILGGLCAVHQHSRVGRLAMVGGGAMCAQDVPPFTLAQGDRARLYGLNIIGLRRAGATNDVITALKEAWRLLFVEGLPRKVAMSRASEAYPDVPEVAELVQFIGESERGVCRGGLGR